MHHRILFALCFFFLAISCTRSNESFMPCFESFDCGIVKNLVFPFWNEDRPELCRQDGFGLTGCGDVDQPAIINISGTEFRFLYLNHTNFTMTIARNDLWNNVCPSNGVDNLTLSENPLLKISPTNKNLTFFYGCSSSFQVQPSTDFQCPSLFSFYADDLVDRDSLESFREACGGGGGGIQVQVNRSGYERLQRERNQVNFKRGNNWDLGFDVAFDFPSIICEKCNGQNGLCDDIDPAPFPLRNPICVKPGDRLNMRRKVVIGVASSAAGVLITCIVFLCWIQRRHGTGFFKSSFVTVKKSSNRSLVIDSERGDSFSGIHLFTYKELEEATNNFDSDKELGDGGFGTVYYGKLRDGRSVAIKRLYENNFKRVEQFMNEVEMLTRLRHKYLVSLYGCTSRHSRELLLVYEYVSNGTVADHLHGERAKPGALPWHIRLEIAIETANALRYLHASKTIHRDVKTNNILLDDDFHVKVADFGLSRLFPNDVTHVSTAPQGTPGYVDPEYHRCYQLTSKSDVFSFGVVLIELISSKPAVDITRHRHEINLWNMAINKIQNRALHELVDPCLGFESNEEVRKTITGVAELAFQCLQNENEMRPTMEQVLDALMGIQNEDYKKEKAEEMDLNRADERGLLKSGQSPHSPDSVMIKWLSNGSSSTTTMPSF